MSPGDWVVDLGANIGVYTKFLSELVDSDGRVYSIEPIPLTLDILLSNVRKFGLKNVEAMNCAISDSNGSVTMEVPLHESEGENSYEARVVSENADKSLRRIGVPSRKIDSLSSESAHGISFVKCDMEGPKFKCVKGAKGIIRNLKPAWLIEISGDPDDSKSTVHDTFRLLNKEGYEAFWFDRRSPKKRRTGDQSVNHFFLGPKHLHALRGVSYESPRVSVKHRRQKDEFDWARPG